MFKGMSSDRMSMSSQGCTYISISDLLDILSLGGHILPLTSIFSALIQFLMVDLEYSGNLDDINWSNLELFSGSISNL